MESLERVKRVIISRRTGGYGCGLTGIEVDISCGGMHRSALKFGPNAQEHKTGVIFISIPQHNSNML